VISINKGFAEKAIMRYSRSSKGKKLRYVFLRNFSFTDVYGGLEVLFLEWLQRIDYDKCQVSFIRSATKDTTLSDRIRQKKIPVEIIEFDFSSRQSLIKKILNLFCILSRQSPDTVIFIQGGFSDFRLSEVLTAFICSQGNVYMAEYAGPPPAPCITSKTYFGFLHGLGLWWHRHILSYSLRGHLSKKILVASQDLKDALVNEWHYPSRKIEVRYHGTDLSRYYPNENKRLEYRKKLGLQNGNVAIVAVARFAKEKRLDRLIDAFDQLSIENKNIKLFLIGDGPLRVDLEKLISLKVSKDNIFTLGYIHDIANYLRMADVYVCSSDNEGFSLTILAAMATGLVCIATDCPGTDNLIQDI
jgi:glycosyltransferase involved in cell wall biosynthesis